MLCTYTWYLQILAMTICDSQGTVHVSQFPCRRGAEDPTPARELSGGKRRGWFALPTRQFTATQGKSPHTLSSKWWWLFQGIFGVDLPKAGA